MALSDIWHIVSFARVGFVLAREGAFGLFDQSLLPPAARAGVRLARLIERRGRGDGAERLAAALTRLGPSYVKFGQFLATRPDVVGIRVARDLEALQDRMPPFPKVEAVAIVEATLGQPLDQVFASFSDPVAAASIAQVHRARLVNARGGREVAVKVLRPGVRERFNADLAAMRFGARLAARFLPDMHRLKPVEVVETLARSVVMEMDLRLEAAALSELAQNTADDTDFRVPAVGWDMTGRDILVNEWVEGLPLSDLAGIEAAGHDRVALGRAVIQTFLRQALRDGFFHADMHPGNLFAGPDGRLVAVDCGIMGRLSPKERRFLAEILYGFITRNYLRVAEVHFEAGYVPHRHNVADFAQAIRAIGEPIHNRRADEISMAKLLTLLFEITALFDMQTRTELVMLQKTMVVVEGVARNLDPKLDMWSTADPVVRSWIEQNLGPLGRIADVGRNAKEFGGFLGHLPGLLTRGERLVGDVERMAREGVHLDRDSVAAIGRAEAHGGRSRTVALWLAVVLLGLIWLAM